MCEDPAPKTFSAVWKAQPQETPVELETLLNRRTRELDSTTRAEIITSLCAALFFIAVLVWEEPVLLGDRIALFGFAAVVIWVLISLCCFRDRIWRNGQQRKYALAMTGLDYYRESLEHRRDHLRSAWLWSGPLFLACAISVAILLWKKISVRGGTGRALPLVLLLAIWTGFAIARRRRQASELEREVQEIARC